MLPSGSRFRSNIAEYVLNQNMLGLPKKVRIVTVAVKRMMVVISRRATCGITTRRLPRPILALMAVPGAYGDCASGTVP